MPETLRDRIRTAADAQAPSPDLVRVAGRARTLRLRRTIVGAVVVVLACAAVAVPLASLRDLRGVKKVHHPNPAGPTFGDGSISFRAAEGWTVLQGGLLSSCTTTATYADEDVQQSQHLGPNTFLWCGWSAAALPPDSVLLNAYVNSGGAYTWEPPNANFRASALPPTLDPATCGASAYEGQPPGTTECQVLINANHREVVITVWFGTEAPTAALMAMAQEGLDTLAVSEPASLGNDIAFEPERGWYDQTVTPSNDPVSMPPSASTTNVPLAPTNDQTYPETRVSNDVRSLPPDGVIVSVEQSIMTRNPLPDSADYQPLPDPPIISDGRLITGGWEGMAAEDVSQLYLRGVLNGRPIIVQAFFRTTDPSPDLIKQAQIGLNRLVVVPAPPPTTELDDFGIGMPLPDSWQGWLYAYNVGDPTLVATTASARTPFYAPSIAKDMGSSDVTIMLAESNALEDLRWPPVGGPPQIGPDNLCAGCEVMDDGHPPAAGHVLYRNTFTTGGRPFDLYVEFGSTPSADQLADINTILGTLQLAPDPSPEPPPAGETAVGTLPGGRPGVTPADAERTLAWTYEFRASISVPDGWTGWSNLVTDSAEPLNVFAVGSWNVPQGGYCAPSTALQNLPSDGALIWIDRYENAPAGMTSTPWPSSPQIGPGTEPAAVPTACTAGAPVQSFAWTLNGTTYAVHVAFGPDVTDANIQAAERALASFTG